MKKWTILILACILSLAGCQEPNPKHTHTFGEWTVVREADCLLSEKSQRMCEVCKFVETRDGEPAKGHDYRAEVTQQQSCGLQEITTYTCHCGHAYIKFTKEATGEHSFGADGICTTCGQTKE